MDAEKLKRMYEARNKTLGTSLEWNNLEPPYILEWPDGALVSPYTGHKREVTVSIYSWVGTSFGAEHYYAKVAEKDQRIFWDRPSNSEDPFNDGPVWIHPYNAQDYEEIKGRVFRNGGQFDAQEFKSWAEARLWTMDIVAEHFPDHRLYVETEDTSTFKRDLKYRMRQGD